MSNSDVNAGCTYRQYISSFQTSVDMHLQQRILSGTPSQIIPPLPLNTDMPLIPTPVSSEVQEQEIIHSTNSEQLSMRSDTSPSINTNSNEPTFGVDQTETSTTTVWINNLKKYKQEYFISNLSGFPDPIFRKFASPTGICTLTDDRLLVGNMDHDSILLLDITGNVSQIYKGLPTPKDILYDSSNPSQAVVSTKKEVMILDLNTKQIVRRSTIRGFYPWNIQYVKESGIITACDPSSERIVFLDKNLVETGSWSFSERNENQPQNYQKVYPYGAYFFPDNTSLVLIHRETQCQVGEYDSVTGKNRKIFDLPPTLHSYSVYADNNKTCLIGCKMNHCLFSIDKDLKIHKHVSKYFQEPYSMAFLSNGVLCVTDWNKSFGSSGGIVVLNQVDSNAK